LGNSDFWHSRYYKRSPPQPKERLRAGIRRPLQTDNEALNKANSQARPPPIKWLPHTNDTSKEIRMHLSQSLIAVLFIAIAALPQALAVAIDTLRGSRDA